MYIPPPGQNQTTTTTNTQNPWIAPLPAIQQSILSIIQDRHTDSTTANEYAHQLAIEQMRTVAIDLGNEAIRNADIQFQAEMEKAMGVFGKMLEK